MPSLALQLLTFAALLVSASPFLSRRNILLSIKVAVEAESNDENILQEILINQLEACIIHTRIDSAAIYIDPTVFNGGIYKESNLQLLCSYPPPSEQKNSYIDIEDYKDDVYSDDIYDSDSEFNRGSYENQVCVPIEYQSYKLGVLKLVQADATGDVGRDTFINIVTRTIALNIFNEYKYNKGLISDNKAKSAIGDAYNALFTSRTLAKMLKKRLMKDDLIGTEMVDNIISQSEFMASLITNTDGNDPRDRNYDVGSRKYIDMDDDDDDNDVILENNTVVEADINTQQIGEGGAGSSKNIFFKQSSSSVGNGTRFNDEHATSGSSTEPNPNILLVDKVPASNSKADSNSRVDEAKPRVVPAEFWSPDKIEKIVNYDDTNDNV